MLQSFSSFSSVKRTEIRRELTKQRRQHSPHLLPAVTGMTSSTTVTQSLPAGGPQEKKNTQVPGPPGEENHSHVPRSSPTGLTGHCRDKGEEEMCKTDVTPKCCPVQGLGNTRSTGGPVNAGQGKLAGTRRPPSRVKLRHYSPRMHPVALATVSLPMVMNGPAV